MIGKSARPKYSLAMLGLSAVGAGLAFPMTAHAQFICSGDTGTVLSCAPSNNNGLAFTANPDSSGANEFLTLAGGGNNVAVRNYLVGSNETTDQTRVTINDGRAVDATTQIYANHFIVGDSFTTAAGAGSTAIGNGAAATGANSVAFGTNSVAGSATVGNAIAIGTGASATGVSSISVGTGNTVSGNNSGAIGDPSNITGTGSYALGNNNTINADNAFVVGNNVTIGTGLNGAVALGNNATVAAAVPTSGATIAGQVYTFAGSNPVATVSVGAPNAERTITNVAAGRLGTSSTDAVNGSQLNATNTAVGTLATNVAALPQHYLSVNDGGTIANNYNNNGATGNFSTAIGRQASATNASSTALGDTTLASGGAATHSVRIPPPTQPARSR